MKTKIIPFNKELAEKIQAGEIEGKIVCRLGLSNDYKPARIICWDRIPSYSIVALVKIGPCYEAINFFNKTGEASDNQKLILEVPDNEPQFKPFDKVLVRDKETGHWLPRLYGYYIKELKEHCCQDGMFYIDCIPCEGNQELVGTCNEPKCK